MLKFGFVDRPDGDADYYDSNGKLRLTLTAEALGRPKKKACQIYVDYDGVHLKIDGHHFVISTGEGALNHFTSLYTSLGYNVAKDRD